MDALYTIAGAALIFVGLFTLAGNYRRLATNLRRSRGAEGGFDSPVPFVGPATIVFGVLLLPGGFSKWIFVVFLLDPDTVLTVLSLPGLVAGFGKRSDV